MRVTLFILPMLSVALSSCGWDVALRRYDNETIRKIQEEETARHVDDDAIRKNMAGYIGERVSLVLKGVGEAPELSPFGFPAGGRATALTEDGYFLTAYHVVEDGSFYIGREAIGRRRYGRIVWYDPKIDVAVVKFPGTGGRYFREMTMLSKKGDRVFSADDEGVSIIPGNERGEYRFEQRVGNGAFFAAGNVHRTARRKPSGGTKITTTLVARGGMSGSPLVTADQKLCGIITRVEWFSPISNPRTIGMMVEPEFLFRIIEADRKRIKGE